MTFIVQSWYDTPEHPLDFFGVLRTRKKKDSDKGDFPLYSLSFYF